MGMFSSYPNLAAMKAANGWPLWPAYELNQYSDTMDFIFFANGKVLEVIDAGPAVQIANSSCGISYGGMVNGTAVPGLLWSAQCYDLYFRPDSSSPLMPAPGWSSTGIRARAVDVDPTDGYTAYVAGQTYGFQTFLLRLMKTTDAGNTFTEITGNFYSVFKVSYGYYWPVEIYTIKVVRSNNNTNVIYVGGRQGILWAEDYGLPLSWHYVTEIPKVVSFELSKESETGAVIVATMGRGLWMISNPGQFCITPSPSVSLSVAATASPIILKVSSSVS